MRIHRSYACGGHKCPGIIAPGRQDTCPCCGWGTHLINLAPHYPYQDPGLMLLWRIEERRWLWRLLCWWFGLPTDYIARPATHAVRMEKFGLSEVPAEIWAGYDGEQSNHRHGPYLAYLSYAFNKEARGFSIHEAVTKLQQAYPEAEDLPVKTS